MIEEIKPKFYDYAIIGMGAAGLHLAIQMINDEYYKTKKIVLFDIGYKSKNDRTWCYWEKGPGLWDSLLTKEWNEFEVLSSEYKLHIPLQEYKYKMLKSINFYSYCIDKIKAHNNFEFIYNEVKQIEEHPDKVSMYTDTLHIQAAYVFTSHRDKPVKKNTHPNLVQHFGGWFIKTVAPDFKDFIPKFMNFNIPQQGTTQFMYILPVSEHEALIESTVFSSSVWEKEKYEIKIKEYLEKININSYQITDKEFGQIPMTTYPFWKDNTTRKMYIGTAGGWTKPSTGYTFYFCQKNAEKLVHFLKCNHNLQNFKVYNRFYWYDLILLKVLEKYNHLGSDIFTNMFKKNDVSSVLKFLNNESHIHEEIAIILKTKYKLKFLNAFIHFLLKK